MRYLGILFICAEFGNPCWCQKDTKQNMGTFWREDRMEMQWLIRKTCSYRCQTYLVKDYLSIVLAFMMSFYDLHVGARKRMDFFRLVPFGKKILIKIKRIRGEVSPQPHSWPPWHWSALCTPISPRVTCDTEDAKRKHIFGKWANQARKQCTFVDSVVPHAHITSRWPTKLVNNVRQLTTWSQMVTTYTIN